MKNGVEYVFPLSVAQVMFGPRSFDRFVPPSFIQREQSSRFQPTYPQMQTQIELPPTICLSDGEEPPPYKGPCTLALRSPEQQLELSRASVRAPPNRTVFDSDIMDIYGPKPPSTHSGKSASYSRLQGQGPPPTYSDVIGRSYPNFTSSSSSSSCFLHQHSNNTPPSNQRKAKDGRRDKPTWLTSTEWEGLCSLDPVHKYAKGGVASLQALTPLHNLVIQKIEEPSLSEYHVFFCILFQILIILIKLVGLVWMFRLVSDFSVPAFCMLSFI